MLLSQMYFETISSMCRKAAEYTEFLQTAPLIYTKTLSGMK
jgi:hypothetical protein